MAQTIIYYGILYILVITVNLFKVLREHKIQDPSTPQATKMDWKRVFFISNEFIYTGSGVFIILLEKQHNWIGPIVAALLLIMFVSTNLDGMYEYFTNRVRFALHVIIILIVIATTFLTFCFRLDKDQSTNSNEAGSRDSSTTYQVAVPYEDKTLTKHIGFERFDGKELVYQTSINAKTKKEAKLKAITSFWADTLVEPLFTKPNSNKRQLLKVRESGIIVEEIK